MRQAIPLSFALVFGFAGLGDAQAQESLPPKKQVPAVNDSRDPLPDGALARFGTLRFRQYAAKRVAYALDGRVVASTGFGDLRLWDAKTGRPLHQLLLREYRFSDSVTVSPDGKKLVVGVSLIDADTGKEIRRFKSPTFFGAVSSFSPDGNTLAWASQTRLFLFDVATGNELRPLKGHTSFVQSLAFSPTDNNLLASASFDKTVRLWDTAAGKELHRLEGHEGSLWSVAFAPDGKTVASGGADGVIRLWDVATGKPGKQMKTDNAPILKVVYSPNGKLLACTGVGGSVSLWKPETATKVRQWMGQAGRLFSLAFAPDGKTLVSTAGSSICFWDVETGKEINPAPGHHTDITWLKFAPERNTLLSCDRAGDFAAWDLASRSDHKPRVMHPMRLDFGSTETSPDGTLLAHAPQLAPPIKKVDQPSAVDLWDIATGNKVHALIGHKGPVNSVKFSPSGKFLATGADGIRIWDSSSGKQLHHMKEEGFSKPLAFSADSKVLASRGNGTLIHQWDVSTGKELRRWESGNEFESISSLAFSPDGNLLACVSSDGRNETVRIRAADTGKEIKQLNTKMSSTTVVFSSHGRILACAGGGERLPDIDNEYRGKMQLWEVYTGQHIRTIDSPQGRITALALAPDGKVLASGGADSTILLWDLTGHANTKPAVLTKADLDQLWSDLQADAVKADRAIWALAYSTSQSVPFLKERMSPAPPADAKHIAKLLADLDAATFDGRQKAERTLIELGESAETALRQHLKGNPRLEVRRRLEQILEERDKDLLRSMRAMDVLVQIGTPQTRAVLEAVAKGTPNPRVAQAATAVLQRFGR